MWHSRHGPPIPHAYTANSLIWFYYCSIVVFRRPFIFCTRCQMVLLCLMICRLLLPRNKLLTQPKNETQPTELSSRTRHSRIKSRFSVRISSSNQANEHQKKNLWCCSFFYESLGLLWGGELMNCHLVNANRRCYAMMFPMNNVRTWLNVNEAPTDFHNRAH